MFIKTLDPKSERTPFLLCHGSATP